MKKFFYGALSLAAVATMLTSCSSDDLEGRVPAGTPVEVTVNAVLPADVMASRTVFSDGLTATKLTYAVYETGSKTVLIKGNADFVNLKADVKLNLITGKTYDMVFWAQDPNATCYTLDLGAQTMTVNYEGAASNEGRDAFFTHETFAVTGATTVTATLKRPFAQINVGTDDIDYVVGTNGQYKDATNVYADMKVENVYNTLNLMNGEVESTAATTVNYTKALITRGKETFPVQKTTLNAGESQYEYLSMGYVLVGDAKVTADVTLNFYLEKSNVAEATAFRTLPVSATPLQRNYRTNIYGSLLTSGVEVNVIIEPGYEPDLDTTNTLKDHDVDPFDGTHDPQP